MASVKSAFRTAIKPILFRALGESSYEYFQYRAKVRDIEGRLVEEDELELFPALIGRDDETIDIGANFAYLSHRMAGLCDLGAVHAFEPIPFTYRVCKRIVEHYKLKNVHLYQLGVGATEETLMFRVPTVDYGAMSAGQAHIAKRDNELAGREQHYKFNQAREFACKIVTLDTFLPDLKKLTFVKMDIEGAEFYALQGMRGLIGRHQPVIMLEINPFFLQGYGIAESQLREFAAEFGYAFFRYVKETRKLVPFGDAGFVEANYFMLNTKHQALHGALIER